MLKNILKLTFFFLLMHTAYGNFEFVNQDHSNEEVIEKDEPDYGYAIEPYEKETNGTIDIIEEILYFLELGDREISLGHENVTLLVGLSGAGRTTLLQFFANDTNRLKSVEVCPGCEEYVMIDERGYVGNISLTAQTFLPHLLYNEQMGAAFYDCPGFNDNRNASVEIANAFFIKKIANYAKMVKLLVVATQGTLSSFDRTSFPELIENLLKLLKDPSKFKESIAIIGTSSIPAAASNSTLYILKYTSFLGTDATNFINGSTWTEEKKTAAFHIIDGFMREEDGVKTNMGYFRQPMVEGYLDEIEVFVENKQFLRNLATNGFPYVSTSGEDFGHSLSADAQLAIRLLITNLTKTIQNELSVFSASQLQTLQTDCDEVADGGINFELKSRLTALFSSTYEICFSEDIPPMDCLTEISTNILQFGGLLAVPVNATIMKLAGYLDLLRSAQEGLDELITPSEWTRPLIEIKTNLSSYILANISPRLEEAIVTITDQYATATLLEYNQNFRDLTTGNISDIMKFKSCVENLRAAIYNKSLSETTFPLQDYYEEIRTNIELISITDPTPTIRLLQEAIEKIKFFTDTHFIIPINPTNWVSSSLVPLNGRIINSIRELVIHISNTTQSELQIFSAFQSQILRTDCDAIIENGIDEELKSRLASLSSSTYDDCQIDYSPVDCMIEISSRISEFGGASAIPVNATIRTMAGQLDLLLLAQDSLKDYTNPSGWILPLIEIKTNLSNYITATIPGRIEVAIVTLVDQFSNATLTEFDQNLQDLQNGNISNIVTFKGCIENLSFTSYNKSLYERDLPLEEYHEEIRANMQNISITQPTSTITLLQEAIEKIKFFTDIHFIIPINPTNWVSSSLVPLNGRIINSIRDLVIFLTNSTQTELTIFSASQLLILRTDCDAIVEGGIDSELKSRLASLSSSMYPVCQTDDCCIKKAIGDDDSSGPGKPTRVVGVLPG